MILVYSETNRTYWFMFGDTIVQLHGWGMFFETRREAVYAASERGLRVTNRNTVKLR